MRIKRGVYYRPRFDKIVLLTKVQFYQDAKHRFTIVRWEDESGLYEKTLIKSNFEKELVRMGDY